MNLEKDCRKKKILALMGIALLIDREKKEKEMKKKRSVWVKPWLNRRKEKGAFSLVNELRLEDASSYRGYLRMSEDTFLLILNAIKHDIEKQDTLFREAIPCEERLAVTLRFLATGESMHSLKYQFRIGLSTVHSIVYETCNSIFNQLAPKHLAFPQSTEDWLNIAKDFKRKWQYDNCIGAIDGKHVNVTAPPNSGSYYYNYKGSFSIVLLALVDAHCKAIFVDVGTNGRCHDSSTFINSKLYEALTRDEEKLPKPQPLPGRIKNVPFVIVGDEAFTLKPNFMRPFSKSELTFHKRVFNLRLSRARRVSENFFGIIASRFRILLGTIQAKPDNVETIVLAICTLHNILRQQSIDNQEKNELDSESSDEDSGEKHVKEKPMLRPLAHQGCRASIPAKEVQEEFMAYFCNEGALDWQWSRVREY